MKTRQKIGRWELICVILNSIVFKLFTAYPQKFISLGGAAAWLTALFDGVIFLALLHILLGIYARSDESDIIQIAKRRFGSRVSRKASVVAGIYFSFSLGYNLCLLCDALKSTAFVNSPLWFIGIFFAVGAIVTVAYGNNAVFRTHSLCAVGVCLAIFLVAAFGLCNADIYNFCPVLGKGPLSVFGMGIKALFMYGDAAVIFFLPREKGGRSFKRTVFFSAAAAVLLNIITIVSINGSTSCELAEKIRLPLYPLTKSADFRKFPIRLDMIYQAAFLTSAYLHTALLLYMVKKCFSDAAFSMRKAGKALTCVLLCFSLCGCYDRSEVEERAYVAALGIDLGETNKYKYTFQVSNPLNSGGSTGEEETAEKRNATVDNISVEADNYFHASDKLKGILSKEFDMAHVKLIVFSAEVAANDALSHSELLLREREIRPGINICIAKSAVDFLNEVKPTLEANTVRYYELMFGKSDMPNAPVTTLKELVDKSLDKGCDATVPIMDGQSLSGMGIFCDGRLVAEEDATAAFIYQMLRGRLKNASVADCVLSSNGKPNINAKLDGDGLHATICIKLAVTDGEFNFETEKLLLERAEDFLHKAAMNKSDILGIGRIIKAKCLTRQRWDDIDWKAFYKKSVFSIKIEKEVKKNSKILQNY